MLAIPIIGDIWGAVTGAFKDVAGWALDGVISLITSWIIGGVLALIEAIWSVLDTSTEVRLQAGWFAGSADGTGSLAPAQMAMTIGVSALAFTMVLAVTRAAMAGSPGAVTRTVAHDLPMAVFAMAATIGGTQAGLDVTDEMSDWIWAMTRDDAKQALENLSTVLTRGLPGSHFLGVVLCVGLLLAMLFLWATLFIRASLIYLVVVFALSFGWPCMVFPALRDTAKKALELLVALVVAKPVITLALAVGISALGGIGTGGEPGDGTGVNLAGELGTVMVGLICFAMAAFMPYLVWKLMPLVASVVVAQGIGSAPLRGVQTAAQMQYYGTAAMNRLASGGVHRAAEVAKTAGAETAKAGASGWGTSSATDRLAGATR